MAERKKKDWVEYTDTEMAKTGELDELHQMWNESIAKQAQAAAERQAAQYALSRYYEDTQAVARQREHAMLPGSSMFGTRTRVGSSFNDQMYARREAKERQLSDFVTGLSDEDLDKEIQKENPGYEIANIPDLLTGKKTYFKDGKMARTNDVPERYKALTDEKKRRDNDREREANKAEQDQLMAAYEQFSDEDLQKRSDELAGNNWAMDPDSEAHTKELNEIQKVQEIRGRNKAEVEQENEKEKDQAKREKVLSEAYAKGENVEALLNELVDTERELKAASLNSIQGVPAAANATQKIFESKDRVKEIGDELRQLGVDNIDVLMQYAGEKKDEAENEAYMQKIREDILKKGGAAEAGYTALDVISEPFSGLLAAGESLKRKFYPDPEVQVNTSSPLYFLKNIQNMTEQATNESIAQNARTNWGAKVGQMAYGVGVSRAKSMEMAALGSAIAAGAGLTGTAARVTSSLVTLPAFGTDAYATTLKEEQDRGVPTERAQKYAIMSGVNEMLFEVLSMDKIYGTLHREGSTAAKAVVLDLLANAGIEGSEEGMTDIANMIADNLINKGDSEYNRLVRDLMDQGYSMDDAKKKADRQTIAQVGEDVLAGMLSGGLAGGGGNVYSAVKNNHIADVVSQKNPEVFEQMREVAKKSDPESVAYEIANSEKATEELTKEEKGSILASLAEQQEGDIQTVIEDRFVKLGESKEQAKADAEEIISAATTDPEEVSEEESDARAERFTENENLSTVYGELERGEVAPVQQALVAVEHAYDTRKNTMDNVRSVQTDAQGNYVLKLKNGSTVRPENMNIPEKDYNTRMLMGWAMEAATPQEATQILQNHPEGMPYQLYRTAFEGIKRNAMEDVPLKEIERSFDQYTSMLAPKQIEAIYNLGADLALQKAEKNLTEEQLKAVDTIAKTTGVTVQVGGKSLLGSNGAFGIPDNTIYVSDKTLNPAVVVTFHELVHSIKYNAQDLYDRLKGSLVDFWRETDPAMYKEIYENRGRRYKDQVKEWREAGKSEKEIEELIEEEIVAHSTEALAEKWGKMSQNEREDVAIRLAEKDRNLAERILDFVRDLLEKFKKALQGYKATSLEARTLRENIELLENFEDVFMNVLQEYGERNKAAGKTGELVDARGQETTGQQSEERKSLKEVGEDSEGKKLTADQIEFFKNAKTVDEQGRLKRFYHGTARADRVGYFFDPERATSGPMAFFTDSKEIAELYSKDKADTSLQYEEEDVNDYHTQFAVDANGEEINLVRYWNRLSQREKDRISKLAGEIGWDDDVEDFKVFPGRKNGNGGYATDPRSIRAAKGNAFLLLEDAWLESGDLFREEERFLDILKMLGIENAVYNDPNKREEGVYETYLNITNPLRTDDIDEYFAEDVQDWLDNTNLDAYKKESASADMWDKNNKDPYEWLDELRDDIKNNTTHAWTSIPDVITDFLKEYGKYDGILDQGGKYSGHGHQVAIPFYSNQIKQVTNEHPTEENPDIRYSLKELEDSGFSYDVLTRLEDMPIYDANSKCHKLQEVDENTTFGEIVKVTRENIAYFNEGKNNYGSSALDNKFVGRVQIGHQSIKHNIIRLKSNRGKENARATECITAFLPDAVPINEVEGTEKRGNEMSYILIGAYKDGETTRIVRLVVSREKKQLKEIEEIREINKLYALDAKKEDAAPSAPSQDYKSAWVTSSSTVSIASLLETVKDHFPNELSKDVASHFEYERGNSTMEGIRYSKKELDEIDEVFEAEAERLKDMDFNRKKDTLGEEINENRAKNAGKDDVRKSLKELDEEYEAAVESGDEEKQKRLVRQAAVQAGYDSPMLYHGTMDFGFTSLDTEKSDDKISFFATNKLSIASSYSGSNKERGITETVSVPDDKMLDAIKETGRFKDIREFEKGDEASRYDYLREQFKRMSNFVKQNEKDMYNRDLMEAYRDFANTLAEQIMFKTIDHKILNQKMKPLREAHFVISDYAWQVYNALLLLRREGMSKHAFILDGVLKTDEDVRELYLPEEYMGNYRLYANTENMLEIEGNGNNWQSIHVDNETLSTREIAQKAKGQGRSGVIIRNITDDGGHNNNFNHYTELGDIYIFFNPKVQVKSADPVTYDDNGNVIPLSERFNPEDNDIRFSKKEIEEAEVKLKAQLEDWTHGKMPEYGYFDFGRTSPALVSMGAPNLRVTMDEDRILKFTTDYKGHAVALEDIGKVPSELADPLMVFKGSVPNSLAVITGLFDKAGDPVLVALHLNRKHNRIRANRIATIFGKQGIESYIRKQVKDGNYIGGNKERSQLWATTQRLQLPEVVQSNQLASKENITSSGKKSNNNLPMFSQKELDEIDEVFEAEAERLKDMDFNREMAEISWKEQKTNFTDKDYHIFKTMATELAKHYDSAIDRDDLALMLFKMANHWKNQGNKADFYDILRSMVGIARPIMDQTKTVDNSTKQDFDNLISSLPRRIHLTLTQKEELRSSFGDLHKFTGKFLPYRVVFADDGVPLDSVWEELVQQSGYLLNEDESEGGMPEAILNAMEALKPKMGLGMYKEAGMDENEMAIDIALDIYGRFMKTVAAKTENAELKEKIQRITNNRIEYRNDIKKEFQRKYDQLKRESKAKIERQQEILEWELEKKEEQYKISRARHDEKQAEAHKKSIEYYKKKLEETRQNRDEKILELRARYRNNNAQRKINQEIQQKRASVIKTAKSIGTLLSTNTDKKHVPEALKQPTMDFLSGVQYFGTGHDGPETKAELEWAERLEKMRGILGDEQKAGTNLYYTVMDGNDENGAPTSSLLADMKRFIDEHGKERMMEMDVKTLNELNDLMKGLKRAIDNMNQLYVNTRTQNAMELTEETVREMLKKKDAKSRGKVGAALDELLNVSQLDPYSYFHRFGAAGESIYRGFRKGLNDRINMINEAQEYFADLTKGVDVSKWEDEQHVFDIADRKVTLTTTQIMSLYELMKRKQAEEHIIFGGIRPDAIKVKGKTLVQRGVRLTLQEAAEITDKLTDDQKRIADGIQRFMNVNVANWGNKTSMLLYGYRRFLAKDYFPIKVDKNSVDTKDTSDFYGAHKPGAAHQTKEHAKNTLVLQDIFSVLSNHVVEMATYSAYSAPIMDAMKWFNGRLAPDTDIIDVSMIKDGSTKGQIERVYGEKMVGYFKKFVQDVNNERMGDNSETMLYNKFVGNARAAAIMFNPRVIIQQPTAFFRANAIVDAKYLAKGIFSGKGAKDAYKHAAIAKLKNWGYYETGIGNSIRSTITGHTTTREKIVNVGMWGAGKADDFTWGKIWNAVCWETKDKHPELREGTKEFYRAAEERYDDIIDQTQVIDSVLHRSQLMRSDNWAAKNATAFMSEPTKSYNLLMNRARDWYEAMQRKDKDAMKAAAKRVARASAAFIITGLINAAAQSVIDAMRGAGGEPDDIDDPKERWLAYWERFAESYVSNATSNINPIELMPFVKDYAPYLVKLGKVMLGLDVEKSYGNDMSTQGLEKTLTGAQKIRKYLTDPEYREKNNIIDTFKPMIQGVSYLTGIGFYNGMRDTIAFIETITGKRVGGRIYTKSQNKEALADAIVSGDTEKMEKVTERMGEDADLGDAKEALADDYMSGVITEDEFREALKTIGEEEADIFFDIKRADYIREHATSDGYRKWGEAAQYLLDQDYTGFEKLKEEYISNGVDPKNIKERTAAIITEQVKAEIAAGTFDADTQAKYLTMYQKLGYDRDERLKKIKKWIEEK